MKKEIINKYTCYLPIYDDVDTFINDSGKQARYFLKKLKKELDDNKNLPLSFRPKDLAIDIVLNATSSDDKLSKKVALIFGEKYFLQPPLYVVKIEMTIQFLYKFADYEELIPKKNSHLERRILKIERESALFTTLHNLYLALNISYAGFVKFENILVEENGKKTKLVKLNETQGAVLTFAALEAADNSWPKLSSLPIREVWNWLMQFNDIWERMSRSQIGKVLICLKYLSLNEKLRGENASLDQVVWPTIAVEGLFLKGLPNDRSKTRELRERIMSLLGAIPEKSKLSEKDLNKLYDFRSRLLHGDQNIPNTDSVLNNEIYEEIKYFGRVYDTSNTLISIILASLQFMVKKNWKELNFSTIHAPREEEKILD